MSTATTPDGPPWYACPNCGNQGKGPDGQATITGRKTPLAYLDAVRPTKAQRAEGRWQHMQVRRCDLHCVACGHDWTRQETWDDTNGTHYGPLEPQYQPPPPLTSEEQARKDAAWQLRLRRINLNLSLKELADKIGTTPVVISHIEQGQAPRDGEPDADALAAVLTALEALA